MGWYRTLVGISLAMAVLGAWFAVQSGGRVDVAVTAGVVGLIGVLGCFSMQRSVSVRRDTIAIRRLAWTRTIRIRDIASGVNRQGRDTGFVTDITLHGGKLVRITTVDEGHAWLCANIRSRRRRRTRCRGR